MSGGVDSSVAALLLLEEGLAVEGLFMKNWDEDDGSEYCTAEADFEDAARVAKQLGIKLHTANFAAEYWDNVFENFLAEYRAGRTPNPDVLCNREIKFNVFVDYARVLGADRIATGHYARAEMANNGFELHKSVDREKDQTYFLNAVPLSQLATCLFPLGRIEKQEVRALAKRAGLHNHQRKDSTGICFIGERRFSEFLARYVSAKPGPIVGIDGCRHGEHGGLHLYTIGQRQGLRIGGQSGRSEAPWYVVAKDMRHQPTRRVSGSRRSEQQLADDSNDQLARAGTHSAVSMYGQGSLSSGRSAVLGATCDRRRLSDRIRRTTTRRHTRAVCLLVRGLTVSGRWRHRCAWSSRSS